MGIDKEKIQRGISSFNNQITRITKIKESFPKGNKVREHLEVEIEKLKKDRDKLSSFTSKSFTDSFTISEESKTVDETVGITENVVKVIKKAERIEENPNAEILRIVRNLEKSTNWKAAFFISLGAGGFWFVLSIVIIFIFQS